MKNEAYYGNNEVIDDELSFRDEFIREELGRANKIIQDYIINSPKIEDLVNSVNDYRKKNSELEMNNENLSMRLQQSQVHNRKLHESIKKCKQNLIDQAKLVKNSKEKEMNIMKDEYENKLKKMDMDIHTFLERMSMNLRKPFHSMDEVSEFVNLHSVMSSKEREEVELKLQKRVEKQKHQIIELRECINQRDFIIKDLEDNAEDRVVVKCRNCFSMEQELFKLRSEISIQERKIIELNNEKDLLRNEISRMKETQSCFMIEKYQPMETKLEQLNSDYEKLGKTYKKVTSSRDEFEEGFRKISGKYKSLSESHRLLQEKYRLKEKKLKEIEEGIQIKSHPDKKVPSSDEKVITILKELIIEQKNELESVYCSKNLLFNSFLKLNQMVSRVDQGSFNKSIIDGLIISQFFPYLNSCQIERVQRIMNQQSNSLHEFLGNIFGFFSKLLMGYKQITYEVCRTILTLSLVPNDVVFSKDQFKELYVISDNMNIDLLVDTDTDFHRILNEALIKPVQIIKDIIKVDGKVTKDNILDSLKELIKMKEEQRSKSKEKVNILKKALKMRQIPDKGAEKENNILQEQIMKLKLENKSLNAKVESCENQRKNLLKIIEGKLK